MEMFPITGVISIFRPSDFQIFVLVVPKIRFNAFASIKIHASDWFH